MIQIEHIWEDGSEPTDDDLLPVVLGTEYDEKTYVHHYSLKPQQSSEVYEDAINVTIVFIFEGEGSIYVQGEEASIRSGDKVRIPAGHIYKLTNPNAETSLAYIQVGLRKIDD
jgi:mannose-6-phosphate isomerase-like protein (cupin superfamily)